MKKQSISIQYKAYKIFVKKIDEPGDFSIYSATSAGKAKTHCVSRLRENWSGDYSWITLCRRAPEYDEQANKHGSGCIAWRSGLENYEFGRNPCHWWDGE